MIDSNNIKKILGNNVRNLRKAKNLSQEKLAEIIGLERDSLSSIETGRAFTSSEVIANISNYFNVEPSLLFKSDFIEHTDKEVNLKKEINRLLSDCCHELLEKIYNIIIALKK
ncbi:TPA: XRE family transcriptional regulator [Candidatus Gastranaerophilales bacterium HUM_20]|nr:helix-turn-helix domain protein [Clostridium sp. CAG:729]DAB22504.1 MAG TPA: XRE family transcriptional regulator [Candidatus Gastranaerophilales bacterium HUM_20]